MSLVPESVPLHPQSSKKFHSLRAVDIQDYYKLCINQYYDFISNLFSLKDTSDLGDHLETNIPVYSNYETMDPIVKNVSNSYLELIHLKENSKKLTDDTRRVKEEYKLISDNCASVSLQTWDKYVSKELTAPKLSELFTDSIENENGSAVNDNELPLVESDKDKLIRVLPYIWNDPTCVLPDEVIRSAQNLGDDDLKIEGGIIELTCPITCKPYRNPMISTKCGHIFDEEGIKLYLQSQPERDCPQAACSKKVKLRDFTLDEIMILRCKVNRIKQNKDNEDSNRADKALDIL